MAQWKAGGYVIREYLSNEHGDRHVHVFLDGIDIARVFIPSGVIRECDKPKHAKRILKALRSLNSSTRRNAMQRSHPLSVRRLTGVEYDHKARQLHVRFEDDAMASVSVDAFKEFRKEPPSRVTLDEFRYGVEFHYPDGFMHDVAGKFITWLTNEEYARAFPRGEDIGPTVGANVARLRAANGLSQVALAKLAGLQGPNVSRLEKGEHVPTLDVLMRVADALGVSLVDVMATGTPIVRASKTAVKKPAKGRGARPAPAQRTRRRARRRS